MGVLTQAFRDHYQESLNDYKSFYDDVNEYGNPRTAGRAFYFIPGFNGVPGQVRFAIPSITRHCGTDFYIRCLHLPEFSAHKPTWEKFTAENLDAKHRRIVQDLEELIRQHEHVDVIVNSSGLYDFLAAARDLPQQVSDRLCLAWIACAPVSSERSPWETPLYHLNGFDHLSDRWFAYPNHDWIRFLNRECSANKRWRHGRQKKTFFKYDLESRFYFGGVLWAYVSITRYNRVIRYNLEKARFPVDVPAAVLVAEKDGYWYGKSNELIQSVIDRYLNHSTTLYRDTTHLWVTVPENLTAALEQLDRLKR